MAQLNPYLHFNGNCREAFEFYKECLGGELIMQTIGESPIAGQMPAEMHKNILHASLTKNGIVLMGTDMMGGKPVQGNTIALSLNCSSEEEINTSFSKLSSGGQVGHPLKEEFWGGTFGDLTDRFGINWMFNYQKN